MELKDIGSTMGVFYVKTLDSREKALENINKESFALASQIFEAWDEEKGERYFFLPYFPVKEMEKKNEILENLGVDLKLEQNEKGIIAKGEKKLNREELNEMENILSLLFGLVILYGKFEAKGAQLNSIKIHLPLFGQYLQIGERIESLVVLLQQQGIFLQTSKNEQQGKVSYQITSNDRELLEIFANWYKEIENFSQITKKESVLQATQQLLQFADQKDIENKAEVKKLLEQSIVKVLIKS